MKKILFLVVLSMAVTISVLARASSKVEIPVSVEKLEINEAAGSFKAIGTLPNPCVDSPRVSLMPTKEADVLMLGVVAQRAPGMCVMMQGRHFEVRFNLGVLKNEFLKLGLVLAKDYKVVSPKGELLFEVNFSEIDSAAFLPEATAGYVFAIENRGTAVVFKTENELFAR